MPAQIASSGKAVAYVIGTYPLLTTTFIDREIRALQRRGLALRVVSIRQPEAHERPADQSAADGVQYLLPAGPARVAAALLRWLWRRPGRLLSTALGLLLSPHPSLAARLKTLAHCLVGVLAADQLAGTGLGLVHAHFADRAAIVALVAARLLGVPYSLFAHANDIYVAPVLLPEKIAAAAFVATCTGYNQAHLTEVAAGRARQPVALIYHGLELGRFQPVGRAGRPAGPRRILSVGQLREKKGHAHLVRACRLLRDRGYDLACDIVGAGPQRPALEALIAELGLGDVVRLRGALPHDEVLAGYARADVFALASVEAGNADRDGIPNVLLEAMAMRVPVVGTRLSGIPELVRDGVNGVLVPPGDVPALADALARLWDDPALAERLAAEGRATVEREFDIERNIQRLQVMLEAALRPAGGAPR